MIKKFEEFIKESIYDDDDTFFAHRMTTGENSININHLTGKPYFRPKPDEYYYGKLELINKGNVGFDKVCFKLRCLTDNPKVLEFKCDVEKFIEVYNKCDMKSFEDEGYKNIRYDLKNKNDIIKMFKDDVFWKKHPLYTKVKATYNRQLGSFVDVKMIKIFLSEYDAETNMLQTLKYKK